MKFRAKRFWARSAFGREALLGAKRFLLFTLHSLLLYSWKLKQVKKLESAARGGLLENTDEEDKRYE